MNFSTTPPYASIAARAVAKYRVSIRSTSWGSADSASPVKPTRSQNSAVTTFRSAVSGRDASVRVPHSGQNRGDPDQALPHAAHTPTRRRMADRARLGEDRGAGLTRAGHLARMR